MVRFAYALPLLCGFLHKSALGLFFNKFSSALSKSSKCSSKSGKAFILSHHFTPWTKKEKVASAKKLLGHTDFLDFPFELVAVVEGSVLDAGTVVVDGVDGIVKELCNFR